MIYGKPERLNPQVIVDAVRALAGAEGFAPTFAQAKGGFRRRRRRPSPSRRAAAHAARVRPRAQE